MVNILSAVPSLAQINGFEVQDTEEALMMFLEQDPVITITVARMFGVCSSASHCV